MLWTSFDYIDETVKKAVRLMPGLEAVSYREFSLPLEYCEVKFKVSTGRKADITEQFVLESLGYNFKVTPAFLAKVFGIDGVFTEECVKRLKRLKIVKEEDDSIRLTKLGKVFASGGYLPDGSEEKSIGFYYEKKFGMYYISDSGFCPIYDKYDKLTMPEKTKFISRELIVAAAKDKGENPENIGEGKIINEFVSFNKTPAGKTDYIEIWLYDIVNEKLICKIYDKAKSIFRDDMAEYIENSVCPADITVNGIYEIIKGNEYAKEPSEPFKRARLVYADARFEGTSINDDIVLADCFDIEKYFDKYTQNISGRIYMISPWLYGEVFDEKMLGIIKNADFIVIGRNKGLMKSGDTENMLLNSTDIRGIPNVLICSILSGNKVFCTENVYMEGSTDYTEQQDFYMPGETVCICRSGAYFKRLEDMFLETVEREIITDDSRKIIACLNFCLKCGKVDLMNRLAPAVINMFKNNKTVIRNVFVFLKINGMLEINDDNKNMLKSVGLTDENYNILHEKWSFIWN